MKCNQKGNANVLRKHHFRSFLPVNVSKKHLSHFFRTSFRDTLHIIVCFISRFVQIVMDQILRQRLAERVFAPRANALPVVHTACKCFRL